MKHSLAVKHGLAAFAVVAGVVCLSALPRVPAQSVSPPNNLIGMWKQNMEKSVYSPGGPPPKGSFGVRQYAAGDGGSVIAITMNVSSDGMPFLRAISVANYDGKEYPQYTLATLVTSLSNHVGPSIERTISYRPIDTYTVEIGQKENGQVVSKSTRTISRDGKTMTERFDFTDAQGQRLADMLIFEKQ